MEKIGRPHTDSFNFGLGTGLSKILERLMPVEIETVGAKFWIENLQMATPSVYPTECRLRRLTYTAPLIASFALEHGTGEIERFRMSLGDMPIMVLSNL
jgi:DNA-directed RNA polymerase beta subunit